MKLGSSVSRVCQIACAFFGREELENLADGEAYGFDGSGGGFSQEVLEFGEDLLDGVQVRRVFWQEEELGSCRSDELAHDFASVADQGGHDHDIAGTKRREQKLLHVEAEAVAVDWPLEKPWRRDSVMA